MSIRKRTGGIYHVDVGTPSGGRIRRSAGTTDRKQAQEYHDKVKADAWRVERLGELPARTFQEAAMKFLKQEASSRDYSSKERHIAWFGRTFAGRALHTITGDQIIEALPTVSSQRHKAGAALRPVSDATRNRYLATIRSMFNDAAAKWQWINRAPGLEDLPESKKRIRWITHDEATALLAVIRLDWLRDITAFGLATGVRRANILGLEWSQVDLTARRAWIHPDQAKAGKPIGIPLNRDAVDVIRRQLGKHTTHVFTRRGKPIKSWGAAQWNTACNRAGIKNFRFHDVRHTWASWHVQSGTPLQALMELGGWASYEMVLRYAHLAPDRLAEHANNVTITAQSAPDSGGTAIKKAALAA